MDRMQKQSILVLISSVESTLMAIKQLLLDHGDVHPSHVVHRAQETRPYTTEEEDDKIAEALELDDENDALLQTAFAQATRETD